MRIGIVSTAYFHTENSREKALHFLLEKEGKTILYATDGAWLLNEAHHLK